MWFLTKTRWVLLASHSLVEQTLLPLPKAAPCVTRMPRRPPKEAQRAINHAILVMLAPPVGIMLFGFAFAIPLRQTPRPGKTTALNRSVDNAFKLQPSLHVHSSTAIVPSWIGLVSLRSSDHPL
jgi:hypothetical protein